MTAYSKSIKLLQQVATDQGFLASANDIANYKRIWARDGVICGLAALLDGNEQLVAAMKQTLITLANHQHELGMIPSNVHFKDNTSEVSFGGLAGRVDTVAWFIIGVCQYAYKTGDTAFFEIYKDHILKGFRLQESWEYNAGDLMYVPRSGNWADEYPTQGFVLYDQLLRLWALRAFLHFENDEVLRKKAVAIQYKIEGNYKQNSNNKTPYHPKAFSKLRPAAYWAASLEPAGYQTQFDAFANSLALLLNIGTEKDQSELIAYTHGLCEELPLKLLPAFWPVIKEGDSDWQWLLNNCKYEFRNQPFEFHNGGTWQMVNGFYGVGLVAGNAPACQAGRFAKAEKVKKQIAALNQSGDWSFYENFNSRSGKVNGVSYCAWSAAGMILLEQYLKNNTLLS